MVGGSGKDRPAVRAQLFRCAEDDVAVPDREAVDDLIADELTPEDSGPNVAGNGLDRLGR